MAQSITAASAGRVNRRFMFLALVLAALSAVLVYPLLTRSSDSGGSVAAGIPVVVAKVTINPGVTITAEMLGIQEVPQAAVGAQAFSEVEAAVGEVARYPIVPGEQVLLSKVVGSPIVGSPDVLSNIIEAELADPAATAAKDRFLEVNEERIDDILKVCLLLFGDHSPLCAGRLVNARIDNDRLDPGFPECLRHVEHKQASADAADHIHAAGPDLGCLAGDM